MEENLNEQETQNLFEGDYEPVNTENSESFSNSSAETADESTNAAGQSFMEDPAQELILGKFKSVDDLSKAYTELEKHQGQCSDELGFLRKEVAAMNAVKNTFSQLQNVCNSMTAFMQRDMQKYNSPEYFQDPTFREIYKEAAYALGENLDTDKFVNLLETYVTARIFANERNKAAQNETKQVLDSMTYSKNPNASFTPPKKRFDEMTDREVDELLDRLI